MDQFFPEFRNSCLAPSERGRARVEEKRMTDSLVIFAAYHGSCRGHLNTDVEYR